MKYLGYSIHIRSIARHDGVEADIADRTGRHVCIEQLDRHSAESAAREIVDYASSHGLDLAIATRRVLV